MVLFYTWSAEVFGEQSRSGLLPAGPQSCCLAAAPPSPSTILQKVASLAECFGGAVHWKCMGFFPSLLNSFIVVQFAYIAEVNLYVTYIHIIHLV